MSAPDRRSWDELVDTLRTAAGDVRSAIGRARSCKHRDDVAAARLKGDVSRLEQSASELISKISAGLRERQSEIDTSFDRERAQLSVGADEVFTGRTGDTGGGVSADIVSVASGTLKQSEPELKNVARALEDVAESAASWIRRDRPNQGEPGKQSSQNRLPLDDL